MRKDLYLIKIFPVSSETMFVPPTVMPIWFFKLSFKEKVPPLIKEVQLFY